MRTLRMIFIGVSILATLSLASCKDRQGDEPSPDPKGVVIANQVYRDNFGTPPQGNEGRAFARVGFLPLKTSPGKVRAIPFFLFNEEGEVGKVLERLISRQIILPQGSGLYDPFPINLELVSSSQEDRTLVLVMTTQEEWSVEDMQAAGFALAETGLQFPGVERVRITLNGEPFQAMPEGGYSHDPGRIAAVGPPLLLMLAGMWQSGTDNLEEILTEFDRPVHVNHFELYDEYGEKVTGGYFTSVFEMAVVIRPEQPESYREGAMLSVSWDVVDDLGRSGKGSETLALLRFDH